MWKRPRHLMILQDGLLAVFCSTGVVYPPVRATRTGFATRHSALRGQVQASTKEDRRENARNGEGPEGTRAEAMGEGVSGREGSTENTESVRNGY
jgi:hypothetical protein